MAYERTDARRTGQQVDNVLSGLGMSCMGFNHWDGIYQHSFC